MNDETLTTDAEGRAVLTMRRRLAHRPEKIWRALTEPAELSQWYPQSAIDIDLRIGGTIRFDMGSDPDMPGESVMDATITELEKPRVFAFTSPVGEVMANEGENLIRFELQPDGDGCLLVFTHVFHDRPFAAANTAGWTVCLNGLASLLDDEPIAWPENMVETFEHYIKKFDLSAGAADETPPGARITLTQTGSPEPADARDTALTAWHDRLEQLVQQLLQTPDLDPRS